MGRLRRASVGGCEALYKTEGTSGVIACPPFGSIFRAVDGFQSECKPADQVGSGGSYRRSPDSDFALPSVSCIDTLYEC